MKDRIFLDTNIFTYSIDASPRQNRKRNAARQIIRERIRNESGVISIQVLQEFYQLARILFFLEYTMNPIGCPTNAR